MGFEAVYRDRLPPAADVDGEELGPRLYYCEGALVRRRKGRYTSTLTYVHKFCRQGPHLCVRPLASGDWLYVSEFLQERRRRRLGLSRNWPGTVIRHPNTSSAEDVLLSSLGAALRPSSIQRR